MPGIIGTGLLGQALVNRMLLAGIEPIGWDTDPERREQLVRKGARLARSAEDVAGEAQIILCLPSSDIVAEVAGELEGTLAPGTVIIDTTTGHPEDARKCAASFKEFQVDYLDATIAGSSHQIDQGEGLMMVGGQRAAYDTATPLLTTLVSQHRYLGPSGSGATTKLIVNLALGLNRAVLAEALALAEAAGMDAHVVLDVLQNSAAHSAQMDTKGAKMVQRDYSVQARLSQHLKDVGLILELGDAADCTLPLSQQHRQLLERAIELGLADQDNSAIREAWS